MQYDTIFGIYNPSRGEGTIYDGRNPKLRTLNGVTSRKLNPIVELEGVTKREFYARVKAERARVVNPDP